MSYKSNKQARINDFSSLGYYVMMIVNRLSFGFLVFVSFVLIVFSKTNERYAENVRYSFYFVANPMILVIEKPINFGLWFVKEIKEFAFIAGENKKLLAENNYFKKKYIESLNTQSENQELKKLLNFVTHKTDFEYQVAYIKGNIKGQDSRNIIITAGSDDDLLPGNIVIGSEGVIGRVMSTTKNRSHIILITDLNSRIPVVIISEGQKNKGILSGTNSDRPEIVYLNEENNIKKGDKVFTSGDGEMLPSGLYIGDVLRVSDEQASVLPVEDFNNLDLVLVLKK
jgi:rod shape-determining protein MreC